MLEFENDELDYIGTTTDDVEIIQKEGKVIM
jgi:hypothetical protein